MTFVMPARAFRRNAWLAALVATLGGGCGARAVNPGDAGAAGTGGGAAGGVGDGGRGDGGPGGAIATEGGAGTGDAPPVGPADRSWIYVAGGSGVERVKATGGAFEPFGIAAATRSIFPSPNGLLIAQELADQRVAVFDNDGVSRATFDIRQGLLGWSDDSTLLFLDPQTMFLRQTSVDGLTRRYLPLPPGIQAYGYTTALVSPDRSLVAVLAEPFARDNIQGFYVLVLSSADGTLKLNLGVRRGGVAWTGDGRLFMADASGQGFVVVSTPSSVTKPVPASPALVGFPCEGRNWPASWYQAGKILVGKSVSGLPASDVIRCVPQVFDVDTGTATETGAPTNFDSFSFAQSADGREAAVADNGLLQVGPVAGGPLQGFGGTLVRISAVGWAHPTGGKANLVASPRPPQTTAGLAGAPGTASRSGSVDCGTGRWVNRTPAPLPAGWPAPRVGFSFAFDTDRSTLLVEGGAADSSGTLPNVDFETMEWDAANGQWTNLSRPDGFGPTASRALAYDSRRKVVLGQGADLPSDGPWTWTPELGWKNLRVTGFPGQSPWLLSNATSVYDAGRDRWILSGGYSSETWEWDGAGWQKRPALPPDNTFLFYGASLVYDAKRARVYSVGNRNRGAAPWLYEPAQNRWTAQPSTGPSPLPRDWGGVAYDARRDRVMVFGGYVLSPPGVSPYRADLSEWDPATSAWRTCPTTGPAPEARINAAFAYDSARDVLVLFGGNPTDGPNLTDVWEWYVP